MVPPEETFQYVNWGGRVLGVTAVADTLREAIDRAYQGTEAITFEKMHYRRDIGAKGLKVHSQ